MKKGSMYFYGAGYLLALKYIHLVAKKIRSYNKPTPLPPTEETQPLSSFPNFKQA